MAREIASVAEWKNVMELALQSMDKAESYSFGSGDTVVTVKLGPGVTYERFNTELRSKTYRESVEIGYTYSTRGDYVVIVRRT